MKQWPERALEDALDLLIDYRGKSPKKSDTGIPVISAKVVKSGRILDEIEQTISADYYSEWMRRGLPVVGDVIMTTEGPLGEVAQLNDKTVEYALGQRIVTLRGKPGLLDNGFLKYLLMSSAMQERLQSRATGSTVAGISQKSLRQMDIPIAPLTEQQDIAAILGALDNKIELNRRMSTTLEEMARSLYRSWFVDFDPVQAKLEGRTPAHMNAATAALFPDSFGENGLPQGWEETPYLDAISIIGGGTPKTSIEEFWNGTIPWYSVVDAPTAEQIFVFETEKMITEAGLAGSSARLLRKGATIISARGTVGKLAMVGKEMAFNQSCYGLIGNSSRGDVFTFMATQRAVEHLKSMAHGSVFSTITRKTFEGLTVVTCDPEILTAFEQATSPLTEKMLSTAIQNQTLATLRDTLLPKLMSGKLRVGEAREQLEDAV